MARLSQRDIDSVPTSVSEPGSNGGRRRESAFTCSTGSYSDMLDSLNQAASQNTQHASGCSLPENFETCDESTADIGAAASECTSTASTGWRRNDSITSDTLATRDRKRRRVLSGDEFSSELADLPFLTFMQHSRAQKQESSRVGQTASTNASIWQPRDRKQRRSG